MASRETVRRIVTKFEMRSTAKVGDTWDTKPIVWRPLPWWRYPRSWRWLAQHKLRFWWHRSVLRQAWYGHYTLVKIQEVKDAVPWSGLRYLWETVYIYATWQENGP